jgi:hypothetical protein
VACSAYSFRSSRIGRIVLLWRIGRIAGPQSEDLLEEGSERESGNDVARPVGQHHDARQREPNRERSDRSTGLAGSVPAAEASAPMCSAWPEGKASSRLPEKETP